MGTDPRPARTDPTSDFQLLLTVIAGISLGVAAAAMPALITGPFDTLDYWARLVMWLTGVGAVILEYLAVSFGSRLYLRRVEFVVTASLVLVFLAQAGMFAVIGMSDDPLALRWFVLFALFNLFSGLEAAHARRIIERHAPAQFAVPVVERYAASLRQVTRLVAITAVLSLLFVILWPNPPTPAIFVAACIALLTIAAANVQQYAIRASLDR